MSIQIVVCDSCGKRYDEVGYLVEFHKHGMSLHLCDECIDAAYDMICKVREQKE